MYLLDTNVVSELRRARSGKADANVVSWAASIDAETLFVSVITIFELELGVLSLERRDSSQGRMLRGWLDRQVVPTFADRVLPVDTEVARACARLHVPDPQSERDAFIAATAIVHRLTVVTRNSGDFRASGVPLLDPWQA